MTAEAVIEKLGARGFTPAPPKEKDIGKWFVNGRTRTGIVDETLRVQVFGTHEEALSGAPVLFGGYSLSDIAAIRIEDGTLAVYIVHRWPM